MKNFKEILEKKGINYTEEKDNLSVGGYLDLRGTQITSLPDNLSEKVSIRIENVGKWIVYVFKNEIKIGCEQHSITFWKDFFKNKKYFETNPESPDYELIKKDFETALKIQNKLFKNSK